MNDIKEMEGKVWEQVFKWQHSRQYLHTTHKIVDVFPALVEDAYNVPINTITPEEMEDRMIKLGLQRGDRRAKAIRRNAKYGVMSQNG